LTRRQREILDFISQFIASRRYSPSLEEIAAHFGLSSVATVHKHVSNLESKGFIRRDWNRSRSIDVIADEPAGLAAPLPFRGPERVAESVPVPGETSFPGAVEALRDELEPADGEIGEAPGVVRLDLRGRVAAGLPLEAVTDGETVAVPQGLAGRGRSYVLEVRGDSMIDEHIRDGDFVIVEERSAVRDGEKVVAVLDGEATLKTFYREPDGAVRLQPANEAYEPIVVRGGDVEIRGVVIGLMRKYRG
jgi:repressor LexA